MIPLKDDNPRTRYPIINTLLIGANLLIFVYQILLPLENEHLFVLSYGAIPDRISHFDNLYTLITSMFLHGGFLHILGNMLYLYIFGDNVENLFGPVRYLIFYILCGIGATLAHVIVTSTPLIPLVGASGAISAVLGVYAVSFPRARVLVAIPIFLFYIPRFRVPAFVVLGLWFVTQLFNGVTSLGAGVGGGVAWFAHIGGFIIGIILLWFFKRKDKQRQNEFDDEWYDR